MFKLRWKVYKWCKRMGFANPWQCSKQGKYIYWYLQERGEA